MKHFYLVLILFFASFLTNAQEQKILLSQAKFKWGDDVKWAAPSLIDETWKTINPADVWQNQGYNYKSGFGWYRFNFDLPKILKIKNPTDSVRIFLGKIDDVSEVYLNGQPVLKTGRFPWDKDGYQSKWDDVREIHLANSNPLLMWDKKNVIAVRVYDANEPGGMFGPTPYINMTSITDYVGLEIRKGNSERFLNIANLSDKTMFGKLNLKTVDFDNPKKKDKGKNYDISLAPNESMALSFPNDIHTRMQVQADFREKTTGKSVQKTFALPYVLTPAASAKPKINNAPVFGVRPGSPVLIKIAATGLRPLRYEVAGLPEGLVLDANKGIISGSISQRGEVKLKLTVTNDLGNDSKDIKIKCGDLIALTPPMGWNSWNCWGVSVSDEKVRSSVRALIDKGLIDYGWSFINIDDGWEAPERAKNGEIVPNQKFPDMKALGDWLHAQGLKLGIYSSPGPTNCGGYLGSYKHEKQDAAMYNSWGVDYLKYDWCSYSQIHKGDTTLSSYIRPYALMQRFLREQPRDIVYSLCQYGMKNVWEWGDEVDGNCWRTTGDITDTWASLSNIGFNQDKMSPYAKPGRWNDPDMLIVGEVGWGEHLHTTRLTPDEQYTHISLWSLLSAPLLIGCDISRLDDFTLGLLTNNEVIAVNQDELGYQARRLIKNGDIQVWVKELADGSKAVGIFNLSSETKTPELKWKDIGLNEKYYSVRDIWRQKDLGKYLSYATPLAAHGVSLIKIDKAK